MPAYRRAPLHFLQKPFIVLALVLFLAFIGYHYVMSVKQGYELQERVQTLQADINELNQRKDELEKLKELIESPEYVEREARSKLGLKKRGERVIIVPSDTVVAVPQFDIERLSSISEYQRLSYPRRWFFYFFESDLAEMDK